MKLIASLTVFSALAALFLSGCGKNDDALARHADKQKKIAEDRRSVFLAEEKLTSAGLRFKAKSAERDGLAAIEYEIDSFPGVGATDGDRISALQAYISAVTAYELHFLAPGSVGTPTSSDTKKDEDEEDEDAPRIQTPTDLAELTKKKLKASERLEALNYYEQRKRQDNAGPAAGGPGIPGGLTTTVPTAVPPTLPGPRLEQPLTGQPITPRPVENINPF